MRNQDLIAEKIVLGGLLQYNSELFFDINTIININSFTDETHQALFTCIHNLYTFKSFDKIDRASLFISLNELGYTTIANNKTEINHIDHIFNSAIEKENIKPWCIKLRKLQVARELRLELKDADKKLDKIDGSQTFADIINIIEEPIVNYSQSLNTSSNNIVLLADKVDEYIKQVENSPCEIVGITTGYPIFDDAIGSGMRKRTITLLGARTGFGKSLISANIAYNITSSINIPVLYVDTEMEDNDHIPRLLSMITYDYDFKVEIREIEKGSYTKTEQKYQSIKDASKTLKKLPIYYKKLKGVPFQEHLPEIRKFIYRNVGFKPNGDANDCLIIYDYFKLHAISDLSNNVQERQILRDMMQQMHDFAGKYNIPLLMLTQLNRDGIDKEDQGVIRGSDSALDPVTTFCIFKEKSAEEINVDTPQKGDSKIMILKSRHSEKHKIGQYISFQKIGKYGKILEIKP